jgi:hypothetical protein
MSADRLGGFEIQDQKEFCGLIYRQSLRLGWALYQRVNTLVDWTLPPEKFGETLSTD